MRKSLSPAQRSPKRVSKSPSETKNKGANEVKDNAAGDQNYESGGQTPIRAAKGRRGPETKNVLETSQLQPSAKRGAAQPSGQISNSKMRNSKLVNYETEGEGR